MFRNAKPLFLLFLFLIALPASILAQEPAYRVLDYTMGLPSNSVYNILQDSKGYIWMGHDKGLTRYNGSEWKNYSNNMNQSRALSNLEEDKYGRIWCQNFSGEIFYTDEDSLHELKKVKSIGNMVMMAFYQKQKLITTRQSRLLEYDVENKDTRIINTGSYDLNPANILCSKNNIYVFARNQNGIVKVINQKDVEFIPLPANLNPVLCMEEGNTLYAFPKSGLEYAGIYNSKGGFVSVKLNIKAIIQNVSIFHSTIWVATSEGVYAFDLGLNPKWGGKPLFPELNVSKVLMDHENSIWISTLNRGVIVMSNMEVQLLKMDKIGFTKASYFSSTDKIILGTGDNRVFEFNPFDYSLHQVFDFEIRHDIVDIYNDVQNDLIWISSDKMYGIRAGSGVVELKRQYALKDIVYLGEKTYAVAGPEGLNLFTYEGDVLNNPFSHLFLNDKSPWIDGMQLLRGTEGRAKCVAYDPISRTLYASNYRGLYVWGPGYKDVITDDGKPIYASDILIKGSRVYVVTYNGSLYFVKGKKVEKQIREFPGLAKKSISTIEAFGDNLWILYENAIVKFNIFTEKYTVIRSSDGLPNTEIKDIVVFNKQVFLATRSGIVMFPEGMPNSPVNPRLEIEDVYVNKIKTKGENNEFDLHTNQNNLEIKFSLITFRTNPDVTVYYNINGKSWIPLPAKSDRLNLAGLSPGKYNIKLKAVKVDGAEVVSPVELKFYISAPLWSRWWFILLIVLLIGFFAYSFMRFRINELRKEAEFKTAKERLEKELQLSTLTSIKSQMNPHFVFNALNTVQSYIFTNDKDNAIDYLNKFSDLTRMILDMSSREKITLSEEIKALNLYLELEKERFEDNFEYQLVVNENIAPELIQIPSMLIQPYVENAIKHGLLHKKAERKLKIEFLREDNALIVFVDDNGIGRKKSYEMKLAKPSGHKSFATEANLKRLQLLNQGRENTIDIEFLDKVDSFGNPQGTMVILAIPLNF